MKRDGTIYLFFSSLATPSSGNTTNSIGFFLCLNLQVQRQFYQQPNKNRKELLGKDVLIKGKKALTEIKNNN